ncbi:unnamed protein product [Mytilus coruscus]|uniref:CBM6 domain-containing protein n=1 Tax=Mytilus coruscus TaxID=42192 RepID=A0A6J8D5H1_MYTCO|nr:unnamed protein product [Mytilus coruscus]
MFVFVSISLILVQQLCYLCGGSHFTFEIENFVVDKFIMSRSRASAQKSALFKTGDSFSIYFCLRNTTEVRLRSVRYSNDGGGDSVAFSVDGKQLGLLKTKFDRNGGHGWNNFIYTEQIGPAMTLSSGKHVLSVNIIYTDYYGIELDELTIRTTDNYLIEESFKCSFYCDSNIVYLNGKNRHDMPPAVLKRKSLRSSCQSSTKNVFLPIYHKNVRMFVVTAMNPKYKSFENNFHDENILCNEGNITVWELLNIKLKSENNTLSTDMYSGVGIKHGRSSTSRSLFINLSFNNIKEYDVNYRLVLKFLEVVDIFLVSGSYNAKGVWMALNSTYFSRQKTKHEWIIPKQSWSVKNEILFYIFTYPSEIKSITIEFIKLEYQAIETKHREVLYIDPALKIEVFTDVFERTDIKQKTMTVRNVDTSLEFLNVSEIVISHISPWTNMYSPIVKLSRQGEMHILPILPHRLTKIPYGSSIIIGQNDPSKNFPMASISKIDIAPQAKKLFVTFKDNGSCSIVIKSIWQQTEVIFKDIITTKESF